MARQRKRRRFIFWLDVSSENQSLVADAIDDLLPRRKFAPTVRDGIMLLLSLRNGRLDLLFEMFPWVKEAIQPTPPPPPSNDELIQQLVDELQKRGMLNTGSPLIMSDKPGPKPLGGMRPVTPRRDDDDDVLVLKKSDGTESVNNFLNSMKALQQ